MNEITQKHRSPGWRWWVGGVCALVILIVLLRPRPAADSPGPPRPINGAAASIATLTRVARPVRAPRHDAAGESSPSAAEIVASKLKQFGKSRRNLAHALAEHFKTAFPDEIERFFDAAEGGRYDEMEAIYKSLSAQRQNGTDTRWYGPVWRTVVETAGAAEAAHDWPAKSLLDYGQAVLGSLRPGMIYVGGTDPGCFIPTFLNETSEGERHITLTQNALADGTYLDYLRFLYGDQFNALTQDDSQHAFQEYLADAQKRLQHDQGLPDEPKQLRPGEDVRLSDGRVQVSGQVAVMTINEKLFQTLMEKNPDATFAMEESFPFTSTYSNAAPLGPIIELGVGDPQNALTVERAAQSIDYWRATAQQLLSDPETPDGSDPRKAYSKMICAQAALFLDHNYSSEAEQAFRIANEICPSSPEAVFRYVNLLVGQRRFMDAIPVVENALTADPANQQFRDLMNQLKAAK